MPGRIVLLRGVNVGAHNRLAMPALRQALAAAGFGGVRSHLQSGNVVLDSDERPETLAEAVRELIASQFGLQIDVVTRTRDELAEVLAGNPLADVVTDPKRYQVSFLAAEPDPELVARLQALAVGGERLAAIGRELYAWHPDGVARSKLWAALAARGLGVTATARNWSTVCALLALCDA